MREALTDLKEIVQSYLSGLRFSQNKTKSKSERDSRKADVISFTYGLENKKYSREEIALLSDVTYERVRQINKDALKDLKKQIFEPEKSSLFGESYESLIKLKEELIERKVISYYSLLSDVNEKIKEETIKNESLLNLLLDVFDFDYINIKLHLLKDNDLIITSTEIDKKKILQLCYATYIVVEQNTIPVELNDLIIGVKGKLKGFTFSKRDIEMACEAIDAISIQSDGKYSISFDKLSSSSDMAYRILFEENKKLKLAEILKIINHRLLRTDRKRIIKGSLNSQMNMDKRLMPLGKSGYWTLREWQEENKTMYDLITETLTLFDKPLKKETIFTQIHKTRPNIPIRSLDTVIYNKRYCKIKGNKYILSEWRDLYKDEIIITKPKNIIVKENPVTEQIKRQVINLFKENNSTSILLSTIVKTLNKNFNFPKGSIYNVISENPEFETKFVSKVKKMVMYKSQNDNSESSTKSTSVFVSYSWDGKDHKEKVISFVEFLRTKGFEADMDIKLMQDETAVDFNRLMHKGILKYDKVLVILSPNYKTKAEAFEGGVGKEYRFICSNIDKNPKKYVFTSFEPITNDTINEIVPIEFKGREIVDLVKDETNKFEALFSKLTDTKVYKFSDVAKNTPLVESKRIMPFTLKK
ncbi:SEFIR domain-containing protein [uncultured Aquimarina sp.]|uniref:SEFIR domain-containing protein n=1 Tax=uncultured Aquimarina sp. TaxID=575652 RepID=UPI0026196666|nr:SEFIR domain-containing protein [uncultured Aquimarina sp.]